MQVLKKELKKYLSDLLSNYFPDFEQKRVQKKIERILNSIFVSKRMVNNFKRILENDYYQSVYTENINSFLIYLEVILKISAFSNYLTDVVVRNPQFLTRFLSTNELQKNFSYKDYNDELKSQLQIFKSFEKKIEAIRRFKRMHILRIGLRDILKACDIEQSMLEYSNLTRTILENVFELSFKINKEKTILKEIPDYALISLGKFGGNELNYSSDVDLICVYDNPQEKDNSEVLEFYDRVVKDFIQICSDQKNGSSLYRIDFRLRPDGKYSPLARSIYYYQVYYETFGRDWERQMLLKMNFCAGNKKLFDRFYSMLQNFIFPRTFFESPKLFIKKFREIQKENFDDESISKNLKHFSGGIRDIEFSIQAMQMLNGGKLKDLRTPNTIEAIEKLSEKKLISLKSARELIDAYKFLRRIENFIQLMDDRQIHSIPSDEDKFQNLIKFLGLKSKSEFNKKLSYVRKIVEKCHNQIFDLQNTEATKVKSKIKIQSFVEFENKLHSIKSFIWNNPRLHSLWINDASIKNFENLLIKYIELSKNPEIFINNLLKFLMQIKTSAHLVELLTNESLSNLLFEILENSEQLTSKLISNPAIFDFFFSGRIFDKIDVKEFFHSFNSNEIEQFLFYLMSNQFKQVLKQDEIGQLISDFNDQLIKNILVENQKLIKIKDDDYLIIGLGSYGTREMHFKSDIDLLFVFNSVINYERAENFSRKILSDIRDKFKLFDFFNADSRLRPEGAISKLSWTIDELKKYIKERMRIWEFQSYTKMRLIYGNKNLFDALVNNLKEKIKTFDENFIATEIKRNKELIRKEKIQTEQYEIDLKNSPGGLMDIQFSIQYLMLKNPEKFFVTGLNTKSILEFLGNNSKELKSSLKLIQKNCDSIRNLILHCQVLTGKRSFILSKDFNSKFLKHILKVKKEQSIFEYYKDILKQNLETLKQICPEIF